MKAGPYIGLYSEIIASYERNPGKSLPVPCHSLRRRVERLRRSVYPPKMVQLCVRILYARKPTYKILKPV